MGFVPRSLGRSPVGWPATIWASLRSSGVNGKPAGARREVITDVTRLLERYGFAEAAQLVEEKRRGEKASLPTELSGHWERRIPEVFDVLARQALQSRKG